MTSKKQRKAGYLLPEVTTGNDRVMVCLCIPDTPEYRAAFRGAVWELTHYQNWEYNQPSDTTRQLEASHEWKDALEEHFAMPCDFCEQMALCFDALNETAYDDLPDGLRHLYDALQQWLEQNGGDVFPGGTGNSVVNGIYEDLALGGACDKALMYGFAKQLIQYMNLLVENAFEIIEAATNAIELVGAVVDTIPYLSQFTDFIDFLGSQLAENYLANYDPVLEVEYACDLFCLAVGNDCELTWEMVYDYFAGRVSVEWRGVTANDFFLYIVSGTWSGDEFCHLGMLAIAHCLAVGANWLGVALADIKRLTEGFRNDPDEDYQTDCGCEWQVLYYIDHENLQDWVVTQGQWATEVAIYSTNEGAYNQAVVERNFSPSFDGLNKLSVLRHWDQVTQPGQGIQLQIIHAGGTYWGNIAIGAGGIVWREKDISPPLNGVTYIEVVVRHNNVPMGGSVAINQIRLTGIGDNPPG